MSYNPKDPDHRFANSLATIAVSIVLGLAAVGIIQSVLVRNKFQPSTPQERTSSGVVTSEPAPVKQLFTEEQFALQVQRMEGIRRWFVTINEAHPGMVESVPAALALLDGLLTRAKEAKDVETRNGIFLEMKTLRSPETVLDAAVGRTI